MNATRAAFWTLGIAFVLGGIYMLYFEAGLDRWVSFGVLMAGFLVFIGLAVMGFSGSRGTRVVEASYREPAAARTMVIESEPEVVDRRVMNTNVYPVSQDEPARSRPLRVRKATTVARRSSRPTTSVKRVRKRRVEIDEEEL